MSIDPVIQAYLQGDTVNVAHLVEFCFLTQSRRVTNLSYIIEANGVQWFPLNKLGSIEGLDEPGALEASEMKFAVSGVDSRFLQLFQMAAAEAKEEYVRRSVKVFYRFFDDEWQGLGDPVARAFGLMDSIGIEAHQTDEGGASYTQRTVSITAQNWLSDRRTPTASLYSHLDQQIRSPGDRGLEYTHELIEVNIPQPF